MFHDYHTWIPYKYEEHDKSEPGYDVLMNLAQMYETIHIDIFKKVNEMVTSKGFHKQTTALIQTSKINREML